MKHDQQLRTKIVLRKICYGFRSVHANEACDEGSARGSWDFGEGDHQPFRPNPIGVGDHTNTLRRLLLVCNDPDIPTNLSTRPVKQRNTSSVEVLVLLRVHCSFLRITLMSWLLLLVTERAMLMSPKGQNASRDGFV